jgi:broad specificity phosphatase PhoE
MGSMEIVLARHGQPITIDRTAIVGRELGTWVRRYNEGGISRELPPPERLRQCAAACGRVIASDLPRSIESARWLANDIQIERDLREADLPERIGGSLRLPPAAWVMVARIAWWLNFGDSRETVASARDRASRATDRLCAMAREHQRVLVVGHGVFNRFVASCLRTRGWSGPRVMPTAYWTAATFGRTDRSR